MNSALYVGTVRHRRFAPMTHEFNYPMFMPFIDLDELDDLERNVFGFGRYWHQFARVKLTDYLRTALPQGKATTRVMRSHSNSPSSIK